MGKRGRAHIRTSVWSRYFVIMFLMGLMTAGFSMAGEVQLHASAEPQTLPPGAEFTLTIRATGAGIQSIPEPRLPRLKHFEIVGRSTSSQVSIVNFTATVTKITTYRIRAPEEAPDGRYMIPAVTLTVDDEDYSTEPIQITIDKNAPQPKGPQTSRRRAGRSRFFDDMFPPSHRSARRQPVAEEIFMTLKLDKAEAVVHEPVIATIRVFTAIALWRQPQLIKPDFKGFWVEDMAYPDGSRTKIDRKIVNGIDYQVTSIRFALIPLSAGDLTIEPAELQIPGDLWNGRRLVRSKPVTLPVAEPPMDDRPDSWSGMVGRFSLVATTDKKRPVTIKENESLTLKISISGLGYLKPVPTPAKPVIPGFEVFDPKTTDQIDIKRGGLVSIRQIEIPMIAKKSGDLKIPPQTFSWYDPLIRQYVTQTTDPILVTVTPDNLADGETRAIPATGRNDVTSLQKDIGYIKPDRQTLSNWGMAPWHNLWFWLLIAAPVPVVALSLMAARRRRRLANDPVFARSTAAYQRAKARLDAAATANMDERFSMIDETLRTYLGDIWDMSAPTITRVTVVEQLGNDTGEIAESVATIFDEIELTRYAPSAGGDADSLLNRTKEIIELLEKQR